MSDVGKVAEAVGWIAKVAYEALHKNQRELIDEAYAAAVKDVKEFKDALLNVDRGSIQLMLDGLQFGIRCDLGPSEALQLRRHKLGDGFDGYDLLGFYQFAKGAEFAQRVCQIIQTQPKE